MATSDSVGITKIPLTEQGDTIIVQQSGAEPLGVILTLHDSHGKGTFTVDIAPAEWDYFVVAGNAALGRPALPHGWLLKQAEQWALNPDAMIPAAHVLAAVRAWMPQVATPLEERISRAWRKARNEADTHDHRESAARCDGAAHAYLDAARMVREQGPTVPRAAVADALAPVLTLHAQVAEECGEERTNAIEALLTALDEARATLAAAGLWPMPADGGAPCAD